MKMKYAIYRTKVGLRATEYYERYDRELFEQHGVWGCSRLAPDRFPILVNSAGGHCSFDPSDSNFVEIIEVEDGQEPLTREQCFPKNSKEFYFGWISPEGDTYNSGFEGHSRCAEMICKELGLKTYNPELFLKDNGWVKVLREAPYTSDNKLKRIIYVKDLRLTKKQADALFDVGLYDHPDVRLMLDILNREEM